jgi:hypothetical protein
LRQRLGRTAQAALPRAESQLSTLTVLGRGSLLCDIADRLGITERSGYGIVTGLTDVGYN